MQQEFAKLPDYRNAALSVQSSESSTTSTVIPDSITGGFLQVLNRQDGCAKT